jgi:hypothetical protein
MHNQRHILDVVGNIPLVELIRLGRMEATAALLIGGRARLSHSITAPKLSNHCRRLSPKP